MPAGESWPPYARSVARRRTTARWRGREGGQDHLCGVPDHRAGRRRVLRRARTDAPMRRHGFLRANALSLGFGAVFLATLLGQAISGTADYNAQQIADGLEPVSFLDYVTSSSFAVDVMENWQSEYLQFFLYIFATVWLVQRGSSESKKPGEEGTESEHDQRIGRHAGEDSPEWASAGGWRTALFSRSLGLLMGGLFLLTWAASSVAGWAAYNGEQL